MLKIPNVVNFLLFYFQLALEYGIKFLETSAKVGNNIEKVFKL